MGIIRLKGVEDFQALLRRRWRQPLIMLLSQDWEHTMCSGRLNDRNGLVGTCGLGTVLAELSAPARLKVTTEGQAQGSPCRQAEDVRLGHADYPLHVPLPKHICCITPGESRGCPWATGAGQGLAQQQAH